MKTCKNGTKSLITILWTDWFSCVCVCYWRPWSWVWECWLWPRSSLTQLTHSQGGKAQKKLKIVLLSPVLLRPSDWNLLLWLCQFLLCSSCILWIWTLWNTFLIMLSVIVWYVGPLSSLSYCDNPLKLEISLRPMTRVKAMGKLPYFRPEPLTLRL